MVMEEVQEDDKHSVANVSMSLGHVMSVNIPVAKESHRAKPKYTLFIKVVVGREKRFLNNEMLY